jgi:hypothetical protein
MVHPSIIVRETINNHHDMLIGSGELFNVEKFVKDLFYNLNLNFNDYISYDDSNNLSNLRKNYFSKIRYSNYDNLLNLTLDDIRKYPAS